MYNYKNIQFCTCLSLEQWLCAQNQKEVK